MSVIDAQSCSQSVSDLDFTYDLADVIGRDKLKEGNLHEHPSRLPT